MKKCTSEERETCNVEKMTCKGCFYNQPNNIEEMLEDLEKGYDATFKKGDCEVTLNDDEKK